ncbi:MAG: hypothetical protein JXB07_18130 [Anaerolineae bacterium]|nr:hypothetical protein [Anaerolineae bacterium]
MSPFKEFGLQDECRVAILPDERRAINEISKEKLTFFLLSTILGRMSYPLDDTDPRIEAMMLSRLRDMPVWRKLELLDQLNGMARILALSDLRERHPQASEAELQRYLVNLLIEPGLAEKVYGPSPEFVDGA